MSNESQDYTGPIPAGVIAQLHFEELAREFDAGMLARQAAARAPFNVEAAASVPSVRDQQFATEAFQIARDGKLAAREWRDETRVLRESLKHSDDATCCGRCEKPDGDGWVAWKGGECPVALGARVAVLLRDGTSQPRRVAESLRWLHANTVSDIVAYRVIDAGKKDKPAEKPSRTVELFDGSMMDNITGTVTLPTGLRMSCLEWATMARRALDGKKDEPTPEPTLDNIKSGKFDLLKHSLPVLGVERVEPSPTAASFLAAAGECMADRAAEYDSPQGERSIPAVVTAFNAITGHGLTEAEGWLMLTILKQVRLFSSPTFHRDSAVDGVAYAALTAEARAQEAG